MKSYWKSHADLWASRGKASTHLCTECDHPAHDWSYRGGDPFEQVSQSGTGIGCVYSENPDYYDPLCRSCHARRDLTDEKRASLDERRLRALVTVRKNKGNGNLHGAPVTNAMRRQCLDCGIVTTPGPMSLHLEKLRHSGWVSA